MLMLELQESQQTSLGANPSCKLVYGLTGSVDEPTVRAYLLNNIPATYDGVLVPINATLRHLGNGVWRAEVDYGFRERYSEKDPRLGGTGHPNSEDDHQPGGDDPLRPEIETEIVAETVHKKSSLKTIAVAMHEDETNPPALFRNLVGVSDTGVEGYDDVAIFIRWRETWTFPAANVTYNYLKTLEGLANCVSCTGADYYADNPEWIEEDNFDPNYNGIFRDHDPRSVLFLGASIRPHGLTRSRITYEFAARAGGKVAMPEGFQTIPGGGDMIVSGWEHVWSRFSQKTVDIGGGLKATLLLPRFFFAEQVKKFGYFRALGIGS